MTKRNYLTKKELSNLIKSKDLIAEIIENNKNLSTISKDYLLDIKEQLVDRIEYHIGMSKGGLWNLN